MFLQNDSVLRDGYDFDLSSAQILLTCLGRPDDYIFNPIPIHISNRQAPAHFVIWTFTNILIDKTFPIVNQHSAITNQSLT
ncbi:hypothetical protein D3C80_1477190 [compost metagenome]